ncbi:Nitrile-specifier protein 5 [Trametes pubescens]|uniref:Nitrile-specifier protein 5 n=1 Tax=Trametes pubescens TaxID=154538 RepID=A0A1M2V9Z1_TRAPU|nr:Nitrile-specifier protein 5 [Trametes pubescens]
MTLKGRWTLLSTATSLARSSHSVSVTKSGLLTVYGGELKPRTPIDTGSGKDDSPRGSLHVFNLNKDNLSQNWTTLTPASPSSDDAHGSSIPEPRVGATLVCHEDALYMWGGRGGQQMTPFDQHQIGIWKAIVDQGGQGAHGIRWERIAPLNEDRAPSPRSYHTAVVHGEKIYVHAGCPDTGRLSTLHAFDVKKGIWEALASAPEPGRGGTCLVPAVIQGSKDLLLRYGGFSGDELPAVPGSVDVYSIEENKWSTVEPFPDPIHGYPGPRSVHGSSPYQSQAPHLSNAVAILYHGERDASTLGHAGAGTFWDDAWVLAKEPGDSAISGWAWHKVDVGAADVPAGRGWFPPASWVDPEGNTRVVMFGGLLSSNTRSDELWELRVD